MVCCCFHCKAVGVVSKFVVVVLCLFCPGTVLCMPGDVYLILECAIVVVNVFVVFLCRDLTTAEPRVNVWRR